MRIAYVSFEYPPETGFGGIATYVKQAAVLMKSRGHEVEVFSSSSERTHSNAEDGIAIHRVKCDSRSTFHEAIISLFSERHLYKEFDVCESPEYFADGITIKNTFPNLPLVVKLHTPDAFIRQMSATYATTFQKLRYMLGGLRHVKWVEPFWKWRKKETDLEYLITIKANQIQTPSRSLGDIVSLKWSIPRSQIHHVPYPFVPNERFLNIESVTTDGLLITYIGRLEIRKGIVELVEALPKIFSEVPGCQMRFVGRDGPSHIVGLSMREFISHRLSRFSKQLHFMQVRNDEIPTVLAETSVCIFPSIWENFPNVCLEAMSAARAIVGSRNGGMKDMLERPRAGILVDPKNAKEISREVITLLKSPELRLSLGKAARSKVLTTYNPETIGSLMEEKYSILIKR